jgi:signal peptidase II
MNLRNKLIACSSLVLVGIDLLIKHSQKIAYTLNTDYFFGFFKISDLAILLISILLIYLAFNREIKKDFLIICPVFLGGASNLIDRFIYGGVIDYFNFEFWGFSLAFNLADIMIVSGVFLYANSFFRDIKRRSHAQRGV